MKFTLATLAAAVAFLPLIEAHLAMQNPGTYKQGDPVPPLAEDGSNFPCTVTNFGGADGEGPTLTPGGPGEVLLAGTAVHGGGSCQISITYDQPPTKNSVWKVMKSFEGGCPITAAGNLPAAGEPTSNKLPPLQYTVPAGLPGGKATVAWTWFNRVGNREMYMRCHKATIGGSGGNKEAFSALPNMFVAQLHTTTCKVPEGINLSFPNPGTQKQGSGDGKPTGDCGSSGGSPPPPSGPPSTGGSPPPPPPPPPPPSEKKSEVASVPPPTSGGACNPGQTKCGGGSWSMCNNGAWTNMGALAAGTDCSAISKRSIRFSPAHMAKRAV